MSYFGFDNIVGTIWTEAPTWVKWWAVPVLVVLLVELAVRWWLS